MSELKENQIIQICWTKSFYALGTSYIFGYKANFYKRFIRFITVLGLVVPLLLGGTIAAYGQNSNILSIAVFITAPLTILQIILFGISLVYKFDNLLAYSLEAQTDNRIISEKFEHLATFPPDKLFELEKQFEIIKAKDDSRTTQDEKVYFSKKNNRRGMRYALWIRQKECATCKKIPLSMQSSDCETCGKF